MSPFNDNSFAAVAVQSYSDDAGEAETGNAGEQPDQGIAGANSSRTMGERGPPDAFFCLGSGADQREAGGPARIWF